MKKTIIYGIVAILIISIATAGVIIGNKNLTLSTDDKITLATIGLTDYTTKDYQTINGIKRCMFKRETIKVNDTYNYTRSVINTCVEGENATVVDKLEKQRLENIADATRKRQARTEILIAQNDVTIK